MIKTNSQLDFLVIGAQKCATTWLYQCLNDHPEICLPRHKKEVEYIGGKLYKQNGLKWYFSLLDHCLNAKVKGDVSVEYIMNAESPKLLYDVNPHMKFILSIRNPVDRAMSAIKWNIRKGVLPDNQIKLQYELEKAIQLFSLNGDALSENIFHDLLYRGLYAKLLCNYYKFFDPSCFLIIQYEEIEQYPIKVLDRVYSFLQVNTQFIPPSLKAQPKKNSNSRLLINMERKFSKIKILTYIIHKLHQTMPENKKKSFFKSEKEIRALLSDFYSKYKNSTDVNFTESQYVY